MSRIFSFIIVAAVAGAIWFGVTEGKPRFRIWRIEQVVAEACRTTNERLHKGLNVQEAPRELATELVWKLKDRAELTVDERDIEIDLWQERCMVAVHIEDEDLVIRVDEPFPD